MSEPSEDEAEESMSEEEVKPKKVNEATTYRSVADPQAAGKRGKKPVKQESDSGSDLSEEVMPKKSVRLDDSRIFNSCPTFG
jgi:hypothetical protein